MSGRDWKAVAAWGGAFMLGGAVCWLSYITVTVNRIATDVAVLVEFKEEIKGAAAVRDRSLANAADMAALRVRVRALEVARRGQ